MKLKSAKGFSLIELIIVIAIIGILALITGFNISAYKKNRDLKGAAEFIMADLKDAKQRARTHQVAYKVTYNTGAETYTIQNTTTLANIVDKNVTDFGSDIQIYMLQYFPSVTSYTFLPRGTVASGTLLDKQPTNCTPTSIDCYYEVLLRNKRGSCVHVRVSPMGKITRYDHLLK